MSKDLKILSIFCKDTTQLGYLLLLNKYSFDICISTAKLSNNGNLLLCNQIIDFYKNINWMFNIPFTFNKTISDKIIVKYRHNISYNKLSLNLIKSSMQKYIRRNNPIKAIWCGLEWAIFKHGKINNSKMTQGIITNLRNRIMISYIEDIGISNINLLIKIDKFIRNIDLAKNKDGINIENSVVQILSNMAQSKHTRICSYVNSIYKIGTGENYNKIKKYIKYFPKVKNMYKYIFSNSEKSNEENLYETLINKNPVCFYYAQIINYGEFNTKNVKPTYGSKNIVFQIIRKVYKELNKDETHLDICYSWYNYIKNSEAFLAYFLPMLMICYDYIKDGDIKDKIDFDDNIWKKLYMININYPTINLDYYTKDIHTLIGIKKGFKRDNYKGVSFFIKHGAYIENKYNIDIELEKFYCFSKIYLVKDGGYNKAKKYILSELDYFNYIGRAQVPTSYFKFDTYFAKLNIENKNFKKNEIVFVKGPFPDNKIYNILKLFIKIKKVLNLNYIDIEKIYCKQNNDIFKEIEVHQKTKQYIRQGDNSNNIFIIYKNLCKNLSVRKYGTLKKEKSAFWKQKESYIVDWDKVENCNHINNNFEKYLFPYTLSIIFRYLFGVVDHTNRNFIISNDKLYSVDEENINLDKESNFTKLKSNFKYIRENIDFKKLRLTLTEWYEKLSNDEIINLLNNYDNRLSKKVLERLQNVNKDFFS